MTDCLVAARARVLDIHPDGGLRLELLDRAGCEGCHGGCMPFMQARAANIHVDACPPVAVGEEIVVSMSAAALLESALWTHGVPWAGLLLGAATGAVLGGSDLTCLLGAASGLLGAGIVLKRRRGRLPARVAKTLRVEPVR